MRRMVSAKDAAQDSLRDKVVWADEDEEWAVVSVAPAADAPGLPSPVPTRDGAGPSLPAEDPGHSALDQRSPRHILPATSGTWQQSAAWKAFGKALADSKGYWRPGLFALPVVPAAVGARIARAGAASERTDAGGASLAKPWASASERRSTRGRAAARDAGTSGSRTTGGRGSARRGRPQRAAPASKSGGSARSGGAASGKPSTLSAPAAAAASSSPKAPRSSGQPSSRHAPGRAASARDRPGAVVGAATSEKRVGTRGAASAGGTAASAAPAPRPKFGTRGRAKPEDLSKRKPGPKA